MKKVNKKITKQNADLRKFPPWEIRVGLCIKKKTATAIGASKPPSHPISAGVKTRMSLVCTTISSSYIEQRVGKRKNCQLQCATSIARVHWSRMGHSTLYFSVC